MGAFFYMVAIMGCGDGGESCTDARIVATHYATLAQCRAALPARLAENTDVPFPTISADCRAHGLRMVRAETAKRRG